MRLSILALCATGVILTGCGDGVELGGAGQSTSPSSSTSAADASPQAPTKVRVEAGGRVLAASGGRKFRVNPDAITGYADNAVLNGDYLDVSGWAAPADLSGPAQAVAAVVAGRSEVVVKPSVERPDLVDGYDKPGLANAGYVMSIPRSALDCSRPDRGLTIYGVADGSAGPLKWLADVPDVVKSAC